MDTSGRNRRESEELRVVSAGRDDRWGPVMARSSGKVGAKSPCEDRFDKLGLERDQVRSGCCQPRADNWASSVASGATSPPRWCWTRMAASATAARIVQMALTPAAGAQPPQRCGDWENWGLIVPSDAVTADDPPGSRHLAFPAGRSCHDQDCPARPDRTSRRCADQSRRG